MLENTWYSVISPESCSSILWRTWEMKERAAEALKLTSNDMKKLKIIDKVIKEPVGGAHRAPEEMAEILKQELLETIKELTPINATERINTRIDKFCEMGVVKGK